MKKSYWIISITIVLIIVVSIFFLNKNSADNRGVYDINTKPTVGFVELTVSDLDQHLDFFENIIGFSLLSESEDVAKLSADGETILLALKEDKDAIVRPFGTTGLFHYAILLLSREDLAQIFAHLIDSDYPIEGASDHLYSEALYLSDPDGNGIEIYVDRAPDLWETDNNGHYMTDTLPLDFEDLFSNVEHTEWNGLPKETTIGHMHLQMADLAEAEEFYVDVLGFEIVTEGTGMLFVSKNRYHHHIGMNTWAGTGLPAPPDNARGVNFFTLHFTTEEYDEAKTNLEKAAYRFEEQYSELWLDDPSGNSIKIVKQ